MHFFNERGGDSIPGPNNIPKKFKNQMQITFINCEY